MAIMTDDLFRGELVRLSIVAPDVRARCSLQWERHTAFLRYLDSAPAILYSSKKFQEWYEKDDDEKTAKETSFDILALSDDRVLGFVGLFVEHPSHAEAWVGIGIGQRDDWSKGYGTDAMRLALRYAFTEMNLHRVSLGAFAYNPRAIRSYEKAGFCYEGRERDVLNRDGERADIVYMGILRSEWMAQYAEHAGQRVTAGD